MGSSAAFQVVIAGIIFLVMILSFGILSAVIHRHWSRYEIDPERFRKARKIYFGVAGIILLFMFGAFIFLFL